MMWRVDMNSETFIALVMGRRWLTILLSLLVILALAAGARYVAFGVDYRNHFSKDDPNLVSLEQLEGVFSFADTALVAVAPRNGTIFKIRQEITASI